MSEGDEAVEQCRPAAVMAAEAGSAAWRRLVHAQRAATADHGNVYALAGEITQTLRALESLAAVLSRQVASYGVGRVLSDDEGLDPGWRIGTAVEALERARELLVSAERQTNRFWSAIGHIGVEVHEGAGQ